MGPTKQMACAKWEMFHKKSKKYARIVNSRVNIIFTLATKLQLELSYRFFCRKGFTNVVKFGTSRDGNFQALQQNVIKNFDK